MADKNKKEKKAHDKRVKAEDRLKKKTEKAEKKKKDDANKLESVEAEEVEEPPNVVIKPEDIYPEGKDMMKDEL